MIAATDVFTAAVLTARGLVRYLVLFVIDLKTRRITIAGLAHLAQGAWMEPMTRSPNLNAYAERFVRSVKSECLAQIIPVSERLLRSAVTEFTEYYHLERNHQGLENRLIDCRRRDRTQGGHIRRRERLGGVLNDYYRQAA